MLFWELLRSVFSVQAISAAEGVSQKELLQLIASIESFSNHPIAKDIVKYAEEQNISLTVCPGKSFLIPLFRFKVKELTGVCMYTQRHAKAHDNAQKQPFSDML